MLFCIYKQEVIIITKKVSKNAVFAIAVLATIGGAISTTTESTTAQAKTRRYKSVKVLKRTKTPVRHVRFTEREVDGMIYKTANLTHPIALARAYGNSTAVTTYKIKVRLKSGKIVNYTRVRNINDGFASHTSGYVRSSYLKTMSASKAKTSTKSKAKTPAKAGNPRVGYHASLPDGTINVPYAFHRRDAQPESAYTNDKYTDEMVYEINQLRQSKGLQPLTIDPFMMKVADLRAQDNLNTLKADMNNDISHYAKDGTALNDLRAHQLDPTHTHESMAECIGTTEYTVLNDETTGGANNAYDAANENFIGYAYFDEANNDGHRKILLTPKYTKIGVGSRFYKGQATDALEFL